MPFGGLLTGGLIAAGVGAAGGAAKHFLVDKPRHDKDVKYKASTALYSPWTKMKSEDVQVAPASLGGSMMGGINSGLGYMAANQGGFKDTFGGSSSPNPFTGVADNGMNSPTFVADQGAPMPGGPPNLFAPDNTWLRMKRPYNPSEGSFR